MLNFSSGIFNQTSGACMNELPYANSPTSKNLYMALELFIALLAITGNFLVCLAFTRTKRLRTVTNYFLASLAVADMLVGLVAIPCAVFTDLGQPHHDLPLCLLMLSVLLVLTQSSVLSLLAVAAERYMAILMPFQYQRLMSPRAARLTLLFTWTMAVLSGCVPIIHWRNQDSTYCVFTCVIDMSFMVYFNFFCFMLVPLIAMFIIYAHIFLIVQCQLRRIAQTRTRTPSSGSVDAVEGQTRNDTQRPSIDSIFTLTNALDPNRVKTIRTHQEMQKATSLFLLLFLFTLCWMPIHLINCVLFFCPTCNVPVSIILVAIMLSHANSALNPVLYAYRLTSFRRALVDMWRSMWGCKHN